MVDFTSERPCAKSGACATTFTRIALRFSFWPNLGAKQVDHLVGAALRARWDQGERLGLKVLLSLYQM